VERKNKKGRAMDGILIGMEGEHNGDKYSKRE